MARYLAVYYFKEVKYPLLGTKTIYPRHVLLTKEELKKAWEEAISMANTVTTDVVDKVEIYKLVAEQTHEENQRLSGKRKKVIDGKETTKSFFDAVPLAAPISA